MYYYLLYNVIFSMIDFVVLILNFIFFSADFCLVNEIPQYLYRPTSCLYIRYNTQLFVLVPIYIQFIYLFISRVLFQFSRSILQLLFAYFLIKTRPQSHIIVSYIILIIYVVFVHLKRLLRI